MFGFKDEGGVMAELIVGNRYRFFLTNRFKYEGELLSKDEQFLTIFDEQSRQKVIMPIMGVVNIEVL